MLIGPCRDILPDALERHQEGIVVAEMIRKHEAFVILPPDRVQHIRLAAFPAVRVIRAAESKYAIHFLSFLPVSSSHPADEHTC